MHKASLVSKIKSKINQYFFEPLGYRMINLKHLTYAQDGFYTYHNSDFRKNPKFLKAYQRGNKAQGEVSIAQWRLHVALWVASNAVKLNGDFVECGVNKGFMTSAIMDYLDWNSLDRSCYLFDTFNGLDTSMVNEEERKLGRVEIAGKYYKECYQETVDNFKEFKNVIFVRGTIPESLKSRSIPAVFYLSIDLNCALPEIEAIKHFWDNIVKGGMVLLDDYAFSSFGEQKKAWDKWALERGVEILTLPTGQGLIIK